MDYFSSVSIETWTLIAIILSLFMVYGCTPYGVFRKLGINGPQPWPFIGNFWGYKEGIHIFDEMCHKTYGKMWGFYEGRQPLLAVLDTSIIKTILVKECYSIFTNRRDFCFVGPMRNAVSVVQDEEWRRIRSVLSPYFTSGRLKEMYGIMLRHSSNLVKSLQKKAAADEVIDVKEIFGPYSMDVVASTSFSVDINSINHPTDHFVTNVKRLVEFSFIHPLLVLNALFPLVGSILDKMDLSIFPPDVVDFFHKFLRQIKAERHKNEKTRRVDFMQLMVESQVSEDIKDNLSSNKGLTDPEILAQALVFIFAGYDTSSSTLGYLAFNLATHPHIQKALQNEIDTTFPAKAKPTYEALMQMEYMDMVLNESQRLYPILGRVERMTKASVEVNGVTIPKGTTVVVPVYTLHHDPKLWPEPEAFKPERFSKENKDNLDPYAFLPFGAGPRNCIGMRFAVLMMKLALVEILQNFSFVTCNETVIPIKLDSIGLNKPKEPIKLKLEPREAPTC